MNFKNSYPKKIRLNNSLTIREVFEIGKYRSLGSIGVKFKKTELESSLFAISVKKKVGNSPYRNRIKRLLREAIRVEKSNLECSFVICFFVIDQSFNKFEYKYVLSEVKNFFNFLNNEFCNECVKNGKR